MEGGELPAGATLASGPAITVDLYYRGTDPGSLYWNGVSGSLTATTKATGAQVTSASVQVKTKIHP